MNGLLLPFISLCAGWVAIMGAAWLAVLPIRHLRRGSWAGGESTPVTGLTGRVFYPLAVLLLSWPVLKLAGLVLSFPERFGLYRAAWLFFWGALFSLNLLEAACLVGYASRGKTFPVPGLLRNIIRVLVLLGVVFWVLRMVLKVDISPLLASTALLTAVIGFALQGVLGNLLAGMSIHLTRTAVPGDWVSIGGSEGKVVETNWRETRLRTTGGHTILIPNAEVASSQVRNLSIPTSLRRHEVNVGASYSDAPGDVIGALIKAARAVPEVLGKPAPAAYVTAFQDYGINYVLRFWSNRYQDRVLIDGDVSRMIWYEFKRNGIEIPFPMSDKLLNDFMAVVYRQRRLPPDDGELDLRARQILQSDLSRKFLADSSGKPLLGEQEAALLAPLVKRERFTAGETLFRQGDPGGWCLILVSGVLRGRIDPGEGKPAREFEIAPGALVGEISMITGLARTASVSSPGESEVLRFGEEAFRRLLQLDEKFSEILYRLVEARQAENLALAAAIPEVSDGDVKAAFRRENIFKRFSRLLNRGVL